MQDLSLHLALQDVLSVSSLLVSFLVGTLIFSFNGVRTEISVSISVKNISQFLQVLHSKSSCFGTLELHVDNLIVILLHCGCPRRFYIALFLRSS